MEAAEAGAQRLQTVEEQAEQRFKALHADAHAQGNGDAALQSEEFHSWMATRRETDAAWGAWATLMDEKQAG